jgi:hypothetical protein
MHDAIIQLLALPTWQGRIRAERRPIPMPCRTRVRDCDEDKDERPRCESVPSGFRRRSALA